MHATRDSLYTTPPCLPPPARARASRLRHAQPILPPELSTLPSSPLAPTPTGTPSTMAFPRSTLAFALLALLAGAQLANAIRVDGGIGCKVSAERGLQGASVTCIPGSLNACSDSPSLHYCGRLNIAYSVCVAPLQATPHSLMVPLYPHLSVNLFPLPAALNAHDYRTHLKPSTYSFLPSCSSFPFLPLTPHYVMPLSTHIPLHTLPLAPCPATIPPAHSRVLSCQSHPSSLPSPLPHFPSSSSLPPPSAVLQRSPGQHSDACRWHHQRCHHRRRHQQHEGRQQLPVHQLRCQEGHGAQECGRRGRRPWRVL